MSDKPAAKNEARRATLADQRPRKTRRSLRLGMLLYAAAGSLLVGGVVAMVVVARRSNTPDPGAVANAGPDELIGNLISPMSVSLP